MNRQLSGFDQGLLAAAQSLRKMASDSEWLARFESDPATWLARVAQTMVEVTTEELFSVDAGESPSRTGD